MRRNVTAVVVASLVLAAAASAARKPTAAEAKGIRSAIAGFIAMPNSPSAKNNKIVWISVSKLDRRYAAARLDSKTVGASDIVLHESMGTWFVEQFGSSLSCEAAPSAVMTDLKVGCTPPNTTAWLWNCGPLVSQPKTIILTCADANYSLSSLSWHNWGSPTAKAAGRAGANDCTPNCAAGHFHTFPVTVTATGLAHCGSARIYTRLTLTYPVARPSGIARRDVHTLGC